MKISLNNVASQNPGSGLSDVANLKNSSDEKSQFRELVQDKQRKPAFLEEKKGREVQSSADNKSISSADKKTFTQNKKVAKTQRIQDSENDSSQQEVEENSYSIKAKIKDSKIKENTTKNNSIRKFMDSLEGELGISAERLSAVLAQLPAEVKAMPIEQSAPIVIEQLGIPEGEKQGVVDAYVSLLHQSGFGAKGIENHDSENAKFAEFGAKDLSGLNNENHDKLLVKPARFSKRQELNATIDELNRRFFNVLGETPNIGEVDDTVPAEFNNPIIESIEPKKLTELTSENFPLEKKMGVANESVVGLPDQVYRTPKYDLQENSIQQNFQNINTKDIQQNKKELDVNSVDSLQDLEALGLFPMDEGKLSSVAINSEASLIPSKVNVSPKTWMVEELPFLAAAGAAENSTPIEGFGDSSEHQSYDFEGEDFDGSVKGNLSEKVENKDDSISNFSLPGSENQLRHSSNSITHKNGIDGSSVLTQQDRIDNLNKISSATETLASKGGGEVRVILSPEGLGEVQLKVSMQEGKVHVEMKTENKESQKLLESSLNELKQNLSSHRLTVDSVKVDVGGDFTRRESSQSFSQPQFDLGREQAKQFINQFRDGNLSQRQTFLMPQDLNLIGIKKKSL